LEIDNGFGFAAQAGVDIHLEGNWFLNVDVKKIWLDTELSVDLDGDHVTTDVDVDPLIVGVGLGYRFGGGVAPLK
jgi:outer membrane protein